MATLDYEARVRTLAAEHGYEIRKRPDAREGFAANGGYQLVEAKTGKVVIGRQFDAELEDVEAMLK